MPLINEIKKDKGRLMVSIFAEAVLSYLHHGKVRVLAMPGSEFGFQHSWRKK